jgi:hypothetical protein
MIRFTAKFILKHPSHQLKSHGKHTWNYADNISVLGSVLTPFTHCG